MADNYVELRIKATDTAKPDLAGLKADLDELSHRAADAKVDVNDDDAKMKLLELNARLAELNKKVARPRIDVAGAARAELQVAAIRAEMDALDRKSRQTGPGILERLLYGAEGAGSGGGLGGVLSHAPLAEGGIFGPALLAIVPAAEAAIVEVTGLASAFAAAGAGAGAFYLLAHPAISQLQADYKNLNAAQAAYAKAQALQADDPTKAHLKALQTARENLEIAQNGLKGAEGSAAGGITQLSRAYKTISDAFKPEAFKVFSDFLQIANNLLPQVTPFARTFADALDGLLKNVDKFTAIPARMSNAKIPKHLGLEDVASLRPPPTAWEQFLAKLHALEGPAITAIGQGIGKVVTALGKLLTVQNSADIVKEIGIAFNILAGAINAVTYVVSHVMHSWDEFMSGMKHSVYDIRHWSHDIASAWDGLRHTAAMFGHDVAGVFDNVRHMYAEFDHSVAHVFDDIRGTLHRWYSDTANVGGRVISWFGQLPGRIVRAVGDLGRLLVNAGRAVIQGLINGIESMIPGLGSVMSGVGNVIKSFLPFSPARQGPLSGSGAPENSGRSIARQLAQGISGGTGDVHAAMGRLTAAVGTGAAARAGYGAYSAAGGKIVLEVRGGGSGLDGLFWQWLRQGIRTRGGNVQLVLGQGAG